MSIKNTLKEIIIKVLQDNSFNIQINDINIKKDKEGNYLSDIALIIANKLNISPLEIIRVIEKKLVLPKTINGINTIEPGIIKFNLNKESLLANFNTIIDEKEKYGKNNIGDNKKVNIIFISQSNQIIIKPEDIRRAIYIDNLAKIMTLCGYEVTKEYYIDISSIDTNNNLNIEIEAIKKELDNYRIYFEEYITKESLYDKGIIEEVLTKLKYTPSCYINNDSLWIKTSEFGAKNDIEIIDNNGNYTNIVPYIAYNYYKIKQDCNLLINVESKETNNNNLDIRAALKILEIDTERIENKQQGQINLINYNEELMSILSINTKRFFYTCYNLTQDMDFDLKLASNNSMSNPIYYIEETNAMICSIINKNKKNIKKVEKYVTIEDELAYTIADKLQSFEDVIIDACNNRKPSLITNYVYELAVLFQKLYSKEKIITDDEIYTNEILNLLLAIKIILNNSLDLIRIIPREEM